MTAPVSPIFDAIIKAVLSRAACATQERVAVADEDTSCFASAMAERAALIDLDQSDVLFLRTKMIALARDKGEFCYLQCHALRE